MARLIQMFIFPVPSCLARNKFNPSNQPSRNFMNVKRAISSGVVVWTFASIAFAILGSMEATKNSLNLQATVVGISIVPFAIVGAYIYFKNGNKDNGLILGTIMAATALALDALITVPFLEIPKGGSYQSFYAYPGLWILATVNLATVYFYWMFKVKGRLI